VACDENARDISVGSFSKTNPPGGGFRRVLRRLETFLPVIEEDLEICISAKRTRIANTKLRADVAGWQEVRLRNKVFQFGFVWRSRIHFEGVYGGALCVLIPKTAATGPVALQFRDEARRPFGFAQNKLRVSQYYADNDDDIWCAERGVDRGGGFVRVAVRSFSPFSWRLVRFRPWAGENS